MAEEMSTTNDLLKKLQDKLVDIMEQKKFPLIPQHYNLTLFISS